MIKNENADLAKFKEVENKNFFTFAATTAASTKVNNEYSGHSFKGSI